MVVCTASGQILKYFNGTGQTVTWHPKDGKLAISGANEPLQVWDLRSKDGVVPNASFSLEHVMQGCCGWSPCGSLMVAN